jgi:hypothetical protein
MPDARDVVRASHCAAGLAFWIDCSPIDSAPIIAFSRETIVDSAGEDQRPKPKLMPIPRSFSGCCGRAIS